MSQKGVLLMNCVKCGKEHNDYPFRVLQVQTFHVRDFGKNSRVQALGGFEEYHVCRACTEEKYAAAMNVGAVVLTTDEAAEVLRVGFNTLYDLLQSGKLKAYRNGRFWKIPKKSIIEYIIEQSKLS
jgi:excisionase family DNA binding protein